MKRQLHKLGKYIERELFGPPLAGTPIDLSLGGGLKIRSTIEPDERLAENEWMAKYGVGKSGWTRELPQMLFPYLV